MQKEIYPCLWFNNNALEAAQFYSDIFEDSSVVNESVSTVEFKLNQRKFVGLNGGPQFTINEAVSFFKYCGSDAEIERIYNRLISGGTALMELGNYPWARKYAWVKDQFGVSWQLDADPINNPQKIVPAVMFTDKFWSKIDESIDFYHNIFPNCQRVFETTYDDEDSIIQFAQHKLNDNLFNFMSSNAEHEWSINEGVSFVISCDDQSEIDYYYEALTKDGGSPGRCGWLKDKYGLSWQVIPENMGQLLNQDGAIDKMLKMNRIIIEKFK